MNLASLRRKYGPVFITAISENEIIPWKQLNIGEFLEYSSILDSNQYARVTIEDEIFQKCVVDDLLVSRMSNFNAGTISSVVGDILRASGPETITELNEALAISRMKASQAIHETVALIAQAFPAYKLEDLYALDYPSFLLRLAQAESKLMKIGILQEPISFEAPAMPEQEGTGGVESPTQHTRPDPTEVSRRLRAEKAPASEKTVIKGSDIVGQESVMMGHEKEDQVLLRHQMLEEAKEIYTEYFKDMDKGKQIEIKTPEERIKAANRRASLNRTAFDKAVLQKQKEDKELLENIQKAKQRKAAKNK
jgi:hypothetical protein